MFSRFLAREWERGTWSGRGLDTMIWRCVECAMAHQERLITLEDSGVIELGESLENKLEQRLRELEEGEEDEEPS